ncbi:MAG: flippase-like domain-containing protein [Candidatus Thermoplasmatota archaeon]|nr:flippase-like domain-containing protein [Candidatus Thermoplasmatota archaeon]
MEKKFNKTKISITISILLSVGFIIGILYFTVDPSTFDRLSTVNIRYEFFFATMFFNVLFWAVWGARLMVVSKSIDKNLRIGLWESTKIIIANLFLAGITPSMAGGEPIRIHLLNKDGMSIGGATASVLGERLLDAIFILVTVPFAFFIFKDKVDIRWLNIGLTIGIFVFIIGIIIFIWVIKNPERIKGFLVWLDGKISKISKKHKQRGKTGIVDRINREVDNFHNSMVLFVTEGRKGLVIGGILTVLMWSMGFMIPSMILLGLGLKPFFIESFAAQILLLLIVMMPTTPGSSGITELGMAGLYTVLIRESLIVYGHPLLSYSSFDQTLFTIVGVFVLLFRFISYHMNLIAGAIFQYRIFKSVASFSIDKIKRGEKK